MTQQEFQTRYKYNPTADCIGEGGFGKVYKAYDTHLDRWVAIKVAEVKSGQENVRLKHEVELIRKLPTHPNIANYEECYTFSSFTGEYDFAVLQYYEEGNLQQLIDSGKLNQTQKETLLRQILEGIGFLHSQDIIHRDLKPQNILIVKRDNEYIPKITDFGISKELDINKSSVFTNSLAGAGTMAYASPEQLLGKTIKKNTDLWSFGVIAYQVLTGKLPFDIGEKTITSEAGRIELYRQITSGFISNSIDSISIIWKNIISLCLVANNNERIQNVNDLHKQSNENIEFITKKYEHNTTIIANKEQKEEKEEKNDKSKDYTYFFVFTFIAIFILVIAVKLYNNNLNTKKLKFKEGLNVVLNKELVTDIDGNIYHSVTIGTQTWMMENLKTTRFRNGDHIESSDRILEENNLNDLKNPFGKPTFQWVKNNNANNLILGRMYTWFVVVDERMIAPNGWRIPNSKDWQILIDYLISEGCMFKEDSYIVGTTLLTKNKRDLIEINNKNDTVSISSCFSAVVGGWHEFEMLDIFGRRPYRMTGSVYVDDCAFWWTADDNPTCIQLKEHNNNLYYDLINNMSKSANLYMNKPVSKYSIALPIRCIKE